MRHSLLKNQLAMQYAHPISVPSQSENENQYQSSAQSGGNRLPFSLPFRHDQAFQNMHSSAAHVPRDMTRNEMGGVQGAANGTGVGIPVVSLSMSAYAGTVPETPLPNQSYSNYSMPNGLSVSPSSASISRPKVTTTLWEDEGTLCFQVEARGVCVARREDNDMINGTKLLNVIGMSRGKRDGILKTEKVRHVIKVGAMHLKGVWIPFERAHSFANKEGILDLLYPLFIKNIKELLYRSQSHGSDGSSEDSKSRESNTTSTFSQLPANMAIQDSYCQLQRSQQTPKVQQNPRMVYPISSEYLAYDVPSLRSTDSKQPQQSLLPSTASYQSGRDVTQDTLAAYNTNKTNNHTKPNPNVNIKTESPTSSGPINKDSYESNGRAKAPPTTYDRSNHNYNQQVPVKRNREGLPSPNYTTAENNSSENVPPNSNIPVATPLAVRSPRQLDSYHQQQTTLVNQKSHYVGHTDAAIGSTLTPNTSCFDRSSGYSQQHVSQREPQQQQQEPAYTSGAYAPNQHSPTRSHSVTSPYLAHYASSESNSGNLQAMHQTHVQHGNYSGHVRQQQQQQQHHLQSARTFPHHSQNMPTYSNQQGQQQELGYYVGSVNGSQHNQYNKEIGTGYHSQQSQPHSAQPYSVSSPPLSTGPAPSFLTSHNNTLRQETSTAGPPARRSRQ